MALLGKKTEPIRASSELYTVPRQCKVVATPPVRGSETGGSSWASMGYQVPLCLYPLYRWGMFSTHLRPEHLAPGTLWHLQCQSPRDCRHSALFTASCGQGGAVESPGEVEIWAWGFLSPRWRGEAGHGMAGGWHPGDICGPLGRLACGPSASYVTWGSCFNHLVFLSMKWDLSGARLLR